MEPVRAPRYLILMFLSMAFLGGPAVGQSALVAEGMITPTHATTASEIVVVQMRTDAETPGPPFVVSLDPPRLALSSQVSPSSTPEAETVSQSLGRLAAGTWQLYSYGVDWRGPGAGPLFEGFAGPSTFHVTTGEVYPTGLHPVAGAPLALRIVGPGGAACALRIDGVSTDRQAPDVVIRARRPAACPPGEESGPQFAVDVPMPPLGAGHHRVEVQVPRPGEEGDEVYAAGAFRVVPTDAPRILELYVEPDAARGIHRLLAVVEAPIVGSAGGCSSWTVSAHTAWAHGRDLYAAFEVEPTVAACGDPLVSTLEFPLPHLETGLYRILALRQQEPGVAAFWAQSGTLVEVEQLGQLIDDRFRVSVTWRDHRGRMGRGVPVAETAEGDGRSAIFYFFGEDNWELLVKVLDGCAINDHHWVFASASTDVEYTLVVEDLATGGRATYRNDLGRASPAITDITALATCE